jgi:hypothetical protein
MVMILRQFDENIERLNKKKQHILKKILIKNKRIKKNI